MLTIDLTALKEAVLKGDTSCITLQDCDITSYLLNNVIMPFLNWEEVHLGDLDYAAFSSDDISAAYDELRDCYGAYLNISRLVRGIRNAAPVAGATKSFC